MLKNLNQNKKFKILLTLFALLFFLLASIWRYFCPIFNQFPQPCGKYSVGCFLHHVIEKNKTLPAFNVEIFYPSSQKKDPKTIFPYQSHKINALKKIKRQDSILPQCIWNCLLDNLYSYAEPNAPISEEKSQYPVIIYLPGIGGDDLHNVYLEELANHGYIVCAIEPPGDISVSVFPQNKIITIDSTLEKAIKENNRQEIYKYRNKAHLKWQRYIEITLNRLKELNQNKESIFYQKLDLDNIGLIGFSHGGAVVTDFCQKHTTCKAGINMDGWTKTYNTGASFKTPFLFLLSEHGEMPEMKELFDNNQREDFKKIIIKDAGHLAFCDYILVKQPISWLFSIAQNDKVVRKEISQNIVCFFEKYLKGNFYENRNSKKSGSNN